MNEYPIEIPVGQGHRPHTGLRKNLGGYAKTTHNLKAYKDGYIPVPTIGSSISGVSPAITTWPFPQWFRGHYNGSSVLAFATTAYTINATTYAATAIATKDPADFSSAKAITTGGVWQHVGFESFYYLTNGVTQIVQFPGNGGVALSVTDQTVQAVGMHGRRLIVGGMSGTFFTDVASYFNATIFAHWRSIVGNRVITTDSMTILDTQWILWAMPGDLDYPYVALMQQLAYPNHANVVKTRKAILEMVEDGRIGMMPLRGGTVQLIHDYGSWVLVATNTFILRLDPTEDGYYRETTLWENGIMGRGAHAPGLIMDNTGILLAVTEGGLQRLGFEEFFSAHDNLTLIVQDPDEKDYYISDGDVTYSYMLSEGKLTHTIETHTSFYSGSQAIAQYGTFSFFDNFVLETQPFDCGYAGAKTLTWVELDGAGLGSGSDINLTVYFRSDRNSATWLQAPVIYGSPDYTFYVGIEAVEFRLYLSGVFVDTTSRLENILVRVQYVDNKSVRGPRGAGFGSMQANTDT